MIVFSGKLDKDTKKHIYKNLCKIIPFAVLSADIPFAFVVIAAWETGFIDFFYIVLSVVLLFNLLLFIPQVFYPPKAMDKTYPYRITIDNDNIFVYCEKCWFSKKTADIKKIVDYSTFYQFKFYFPRSQMYFVCQKDLITEGTIEEFEETFKDVIIRKK